MNAKITILAIALLMGLGITEKAQGMKRERESAVEQTEQKKQKTFDAQATQRLLAAAKLGHFETAQAEIDNGADINARDANGRTPLIHACLYGRLPSIELLVKNGAHINARDNTDNTPLTYACTGVEYIHGGNVINFLINNGADSNIQGKYGRNLKNGLLVHAVNTGDTKLARRTLSRKNREKRGRLNTFRNDKTPLLQIAEQRGDETIVQFLCQEWAKKAPNKETNQLAIEQLLYAVNAGNVQEAAYTITQGADVNVYINGITPLHLACFKGDCNIIQLLLENGADLEAKTNKNQTLLTLTPLTILRLIRAIPEIFQHDDQSNTPLQQACIQGQLEVVKLLLKKGANVMAGIEDNRTPLQLVCGINEHPRMPAMTFLALVKELVTYGAKVHGEKDKELVRNLLILESPNLQIPPKKTESLLERQYVAIEYMRACLHTGEANAIKQLVRAIVANDAHAVQQALKSDVDVNIFPKDNVSLVHYAVARGYKEIVALLLDKHANVNTHEATTGDTPLHTACRLGNRTLVQLLVKAGAGLKAVNKNNQTPFMIAQKTKDRNNNDIIVGGSQPRLIQSIITSYLREPRCKQKHRFQKRGIAQYLHAIGKNGKVTNLQECGFKKSSKKQQDRPMVGGLRLRPTINQ